MKSILVIVCTVLGSFRWLGASSAYLSKAVFGAKPRTTFQRHAWEPSQEKYALYLTEAAAPKA